MAVVFRAGTTEIVDPPARRTTVVRSAQGQPALYVMQVSDFFHPCASEIDPTISADERGFEFCQQIAVTRDDSVGDGLSNTDRTAARGNLFRLTSTEQQPNLIPTARARG